MGMEEAIAGEKVRERETGSEETRVVQDKTKGSKLGTSHTR